eukprot:m.30683 g.30683  ORF g.30683 m.30683 type:complete len:196 (+) comp13895_c0_seq2:401-988(+)
MGCTQSSTGKGKGLSECIFFPDNAMPCRNYTSPRGCRRNSCSYAPCNGSGNTSLMRFLQILGSARHTLDICVYTITCNEIADAVLEAMKRGVRVRLITDDEQINAQGSDVHRLANAGAQSRHDNASSHMHHKFAIVDSSTLLTGSFNWTRSAVLYNRENVIITKDRSVINAFAAEFAKMWELYKSRTHIIAKTMV